MPQKQPPASTARSSFMVILHLVQVATIALRFHAVKTWPSASTGPMPHCDRPAACARGRPCCSARNPPTAIAATAGADDVAATNRALAQQKGPVIVVGHSWAGAVITEAGVDPKVAGLVYVAAFAPDADEIIGELGKNYATPASFSAPIIDAQGFMSLSSETFVKDFALDLPAAEARVLAATQTPIATSAFGAKVANVAWKTKPSWYIVAKKDRAIAPDLERFQAKRMKATTTELDTSHVPMLSKPKDVAAVIMAAAASAPH